jgi:hypothetical protein
LEQPNEDQSDELSYLDQPKDLSYLELSYPEEQAKDLGYLDQAKDLSYLEYPGDEVKSWYLDGSDDLAGQLYAMQKEKRSSENPEGYRLTQVLILIFKGLDLRDCEACWFNVFG